MTSTAQVLTYRGGNQPDPGDSWASPIRMLYRMTIEVRDAFGSRFYYLLVANYHNAEAIQRVFDGVSTIDVSFEPDVLSYINRVYPHLDTDLPVISPSDDDCVDLSTL